jgi:3',5'-cyclic AMP phosphodiesterase CpdA
MSKNIFKFAFIADPQIGMNSRFGMKGPKSDFVRLNTAIQYINENNISFAVFGGDQINNAKGEHTNQQLDVLQESLSKLIVPYYGVIGNHEQGDPKEAWQYIERGLPVRFSFSFGNTQFVGVNASWLRGDFGDEYMQKEFNFLKESFAQQKKGLKHRFVVMHGPLFNCHPDEDNTYWNMANRMILIDFFKKHDVSCVLSGHWQQDLDATWQGIQFITSVGTSLPLQYPEELSFKVITVFEDGWSIRRVTVEG